MAWQSQHRSSARAIRATRRKDRLSIMVLNKTKDGRPGMSVTQVLLLANLIVMSLSSYQYLKSAINDGTSVVQGEEASRLPPSDLEDRINSSSSTEVAAVSITSDHPPEVEHHIPAEVNRRSSSLLKGPVIADTPPGGIGQLHSGGAYFVKPREGERDFYETAKTTATDKVTAPSMLGTTVYFLATFPSFLAL